MLLQLTIQNFALISRMTLEFGTGLNVLTGETGAGKSILIDALRVALGERAGSEIFRSKEESCMIEAVFAVPAALRKRSEIIREFLAEEDDCLVLKREISPEGRSKNYANRRVVNLSVLKEIGAQLIDFHGQYDQQQIFLPETHREMLDRLSGLKGGKEQPLLREYEDLFEKYQALRARQEELRRAGESKQRQMDLLKYQIEEIEKSAPEEGEEEDLASERIRLAHSQKLYELTRDILNSLDEEGSASARLTGAFKPFLLWSKIDSAAEKLQKDLEAVQAGLEELIRSVRDYQESLTFDESRLEEIEERLGDLERLKRKYGGSIAAVLGFLEESKKQYDDLVNAEVYQLDLEKEIRKILPDLNSRAEEISTIRKKTAASLKKEVERELADLGIPHAQFDCRFTPGDLSRRGNEEIEFLLSPNPGLGLKPLAQIASGGEASRILLALKKALARVDETPALIFDEIDANIGGRLGAVVGRKLREIAEERQILLITHLPQIASFAVRHFKVAKTVIRSRTEVSYYLLEGEERVKELAQMMSGMKETEISRTHAKEMLKTASK